MVTLIWVQAGNGVYELMDRVHPGGGNTFEKLCTGNGRAPGKPLKTVGWADITGAHPYVSRFGKSHSSASCVWE